MIKCLSIPAILASTLLVHTAAFAQTGNAPCGSFRKLSDGKWAVVKTVKIEHGSQAPL